MASPKVKVTARPNCPLSDKQARVLCREVEDLYGSGVLVTPKSLLAKAKEKDSPIHSFFDWDDESAAEKHRIEQARGLLGCIQVFEIRTGRPARAFYSVNVETTEEGGAKRSFHPRRVILDNEDAMQQVSLRLYSTISAAIREAEGLGLTETDAAWKRIAAVVRQEPPSAAALSKASA